VRNNKIIPKSGLFYYNIIYNKKEMKKIFLLLISISAIFLFNLAEAKNENKVYNIYNLEKIIFPLNKEGIKQIKEKINIICYNQTNEQTDKISFICKDKWLNSNKSWCWIIRNTFDSLNWYYCILNNISDNKKNRLDFIIPKYNTDHLYPKEFDISFKMKEKSIQEKTLSCEISAVSDILTNKLWYNITEDELINKIEKSHAEKDAWIEKEKIFWWDPDRWFVWYIDIHPKTKTRASQRKYQWYGVYEAPISKIYTNYGIENIIINAYTREQIWLKDQKEHLSFLLKNLIDWNYIQLWWDICTYPEYEDGIEIGKINTNQANSWISWKNICANPYRERILTWNYKKEDWSLKQINWLNWEHAFYLLWYKWNISEPSHIIVWDTNTWKHTYPTIEWLRKWWKMDDRSILIR